MQQRVRFARLVTIVCGVAVMAAMIPRWGWLVIPPTVAMLLIVVIGAARLGRRRRPELWVFVTTVLNIQLVVAAVAVTTGGPRTSLSCLLAAPVLMVGARFSRRGLVLGTPISLVLVLVATVGADPAYAWRHPEAVLVPLAIVAITAAYMSPLVASDERHRTESTLDALTGLLNRRALRTRLGEVAEQAAINGEPVSMIAVDVDRFKQINDAHGHDTGDLVLCEIAHTLRVNLRTFELLYRVGGDEFLLLLPGATAHTAIRIAQALRDAVAAARPFGLAVTCSFGTATAEATEDPRALAAKADDALYRAKHHGRNRIETTQPAAPLSTSDDRASGPGLLVRA